MASCFARRQTSRFLGPLLSSSLPHLCTRNGVPGSTRISPLLTQFFDSNTVKSHPSSPIEKLNFRDSFTNKFVSEFSSNPQILTRPNPSGVYQKFHIKPKGSSLSDLFLSTNGQRVVFSSSSEQPSGGDESRYRGACEPTFDRDETALVNETREVAEMVLTNIFSLSKALSFICVVPLGLGCWFMIGSGYSSMADILLPGILASGLSFSVVFIVIIRSLKPISFFVQKMQDQGRLHTMTLKFEIAKHKNLVFAHFRKVSLFGIAVCLLGHALHYLG